MHYRAILNRGSHFEVFRCDRELLPLVYLGMIKRGDLVVDQRYKSFLSSTSDVVFFEVTASCFISYQSRQNQIANLRLASLF